MNIAMLEVTIFKALAHPLRLKILKMLGSKELCVCELNEDELFTQSNISQHLRILKDADLVVQRKEGLKVYYSIKDDRLMDMIDLADGMIKTNIQELDDVIK